MDLCFYALEDMLMEMFSQRCSDRASKVLKPTKPKHAKQIACIEKIY